MDYGLITSHNNRDGELKFDPSIDRGKIYALDREQMVAFVGACNDLVGMAFNCWNWGKDLDEEIKVDFRVELPQSDNPESL